MNSTGCRNVSKFSQNVSFYDQLLIAIENSLYGGDILEIAAIIGLLLIVISAYIMYRLTSKVSGEISSNEPMKRIKISSTEQHWLKVADSYQSRRDRSIVDHKYTLKELHEATDKCNQEVYALRCIELVSYCPYLVNIGWKPNGLTPFHRVCLRGNISLMEFMLAKGADPFLKLATGENALFLTIYHYLNNPAKKDLSCLDILYETGCKLHYSNKWYKRFLKTATVTNHTALARWLLEHAESPSKVYKRGDSVPPNTPKSVTRLM